uniref:Phorbol-ester/DAG-type domain-containing protein n=1 Tax=viral metagenome TaxID=1070528 RepID=A0A6H1ZDQ4_9ZZZZ
MNSGSSASFRAAAELPDRPDDCEHGVPEDVGCYECERAARMRDLEEFDDQVARLEEKLESMIAPPVVLYTVATDDLRHVEVGIADEEGDPSDVEIDATAILDIVRELRRRLDKAEEKAQTYERDWREAKYEFGKTMADLRAKLDAAKSNEHIDGVFCPRCGKRVVEGEGVACPACGVVEHRDCRGPISHVCSHGKSCPLCAAIASRDQAVSEFVDRHHPVRWCWRCGVYLHHYYDDAHVLRCKNCDSEVCKGADGLDMVGCEDEGPRPGFLPHPGAATEEGR